MTTTQAEIVREAIQRDYFPSDDYIRLTAPIVEAVRKYLSTSPGPNKARAINALDDALRALDKAIPRGE